MAVALCGAVGASFAVTTAAGVIPFQCIVKSKLLWLQMSVRVSVYYVLIWNMFDMAILYAFQLVLNRSALYYWLNSNGLQVKLRGRHKYRVSIEGIDMCNTICIACRFLIIIICDFKGKNNYSKPTHCIHTVFLCSSDCAFIIVILVIIGAKHLLLQYADLNHCWK